MLPASFVTTVAAAPAAANVMGIDFGTEFMKVALVQPGSPLEIVTNTVSKRKSETVVAFVRGERLFASDAYGSLSRKPEQSYARLTEYLGRSETHPSIETLRTKSYFPTTTRFNESRGALAIAAPYAAAVLARLGATVTAQEADQAVLDVVAAGLSDAGVETAIAPFAQPQGEGYDIIISEGAVATRPQAWLDALAVGGRLAVVERKGAAGRGVLYVRGRDGFSRRELFDGAPPMLDGMTPEPAFSF